MAIHVAILKPMYLDAVLSGAKTVESRLTRTRQPPHGCIAVGERLFFKDSGGAFRATGLAAAVDEHSELTPEGMDRLEAAYRPRVGGDDAYWQGKRTSRFAVFVTLTDVTPLDVGPRYPANAWRAWHVVDERLSPIRDVSLTDAAIRNRVVRLPQPGDRLRNNPFTLHLPGGERVDTDLSPRGHVRWRGWKAGFERYRLRPGDRVRFIHTPPGSAPPRSAPRSAPGSSAPGSWAPGSGTPGLAYRVEYHLRDDTGTVFARITP